MAFNIGDNGSYRRKVWLIQK